MSRLKSLLEAHPEWIPPRSDEHTVIGVPHTRDHRKTFAEPGGSFSPGVGTFGVSVWLYDHGADRFYAPERMDREELHWRWEQGYLPILNSAWEASGISVEQELFADQLGTLENIVNSQRVVLKNRGDHAASLTVYVTVRPYGPAGGLIQRLELGPAECHVNGRLVMLAGAPAESFGTVSYGEHGEDISAYLQKGGLPVQSKANDEKAARPGCCSGALAYAVKLDPGEQQSFDFDWYVHPLEEHYEDAFRTYHEGGYETKKAKVRKEWETLLHATALSVPDERFKNAYYSTLAQFLVASVNHEPRIATITYPLFWIRDGVYIMNALDKAGLHEEARLQLDKLKGLLFAGGFGAEPDALGGTIWPFWTHYRLTGDREWLREVYPAIQERAEWIIRCRHSQTYMYHDVEMRVPDQRNTAQTDLICEPARDGLIIGRMDWHRPLLWINAFSFLGLRGASEMAAVLGMEEEAERYRLEASDLKVSLERYAKDHFGGNERDTVCALWPTEALDSSSADLLESYESRWNQVRLQGNGEYAPEPLWKYFELGQAHNYLWLGDREKVWTSLHYYLDHHDVKGLFGWLEDNHDIAEYWSQIEGWYQLPSRQPHGWVSSELFLLLRDMLAYEQGDTLIIGEGIPAEWLKMGSAVHISRFATFFGPVDLSLEVKEGGRLILELSFHRTDRLPELVDLRLPWPEGELYTNMGTKQAERVWFGRTYYENKGVFTLQVEMPEEEM
ncbi:hypothetical protein [Paenibacillus gansuensis]|uniref:Alpha-L-rhamnosidase six-hairpin glycosidase domain-containing protein n=1 Tax=Paenibacillus gansuensis TaxID=306542 RepID=A0ABW5PDS8_9BACL